MEYSKHKDLPPSETIKRAQTILKSLKLEWKETLNHPSTNLYSTRLEIINLGWGTNGKGTTEEYCRASAYGEMLERLQNLHLPDSLMETASDYANKYRNFKFYPDESSVTLERILTEFVDLKEDMQKSFFESDKRLPSDKELYDIWRKWNDNKDSFTSIPFYSAQKKKVQNLPIEIIRRLCRSNGIASGNSFDEALCQALSEIIERHALEVIFTKQLTPPTIQKDFIKKHSPELHNTIMEIEGKGPFNIIVYDASLGEQLPVVCVVFIDRLEQKYRIKLGCHPLFNIALERCLTELGQGCDFTIESNKKFLTPLSLTDIDEWDTFKNWSGMFRSNHGHIPLCFFYGEPSWTFHAWESIENYNNHIGAKKMMEICLNITNDIYIRDNSFLGFPCVRVYAPKITPVYKFNPLGKARMLDKRIIRILQHFPLHVNNLSNEEKQQIYSIFKNDYHTIYTEGLGVSLPVLLGAINADLGNIDTALYYLRRENEPSLFIKAAIKELEMITKDINVSDRNCILTSFFGAKYKVYIELNWRQGNIVGGLFDPFRLKSRINSIANSKSVSTNITVSNLIVLLKDKMCEDILDQISVSKHFD